MISWIPQSVGSDFQKLPPPSNIQARIERQMRNLQGSR